MYITQVGAEIFSKLSADIVVIRIPACEFFLRLIAKLSAENFTSSTKIVVNFEFLQKTDLLPLGNGINDYDTWELK